MQILVALELDDDAVSKAYGSEVWTPFADDDLVAALDARLDEVYLGRDNYPVRARVLAVGDFTGTLPFALDALEVGAEGADIIGRDVVTHVLGSVQTMRTMLDGEPSGGGDAKSLDWD